jgi:hypothetical protein
MTNRTSSFRPLLPCLLTLPLVLLLGSGCGGKDDGSDDTGDSGDTDDISVTLGGEGAFSVKSAIAWTRIPGSTVPAQFFLLIAGWEMTCDVFSTWEARHWPVLGDGGYAYIQLVAYETPFVGTYDGLEGDPSCYDSGTFEVICPRMVSDTTAWGQISNCVSDAQEATFDATENEPEAPVVNIVSVTTDNIQGNFDLDGLLTGVFDMPVCGNNL